MSDIDKTAQLINRSFLLLYSSYTSINIFYALVHTLMIQVSNKYISISARRTMHWSALGYVKVLGNTMNFYDETY